LREQGFLESVAKGSHHDFRLESEDRQEGAVGQEKAVGNQTMQVG